MKSAFVCVMNPSLPFGLASDPFFAQGYRQPISKNMVPPVIIEMAEDPETLAPLFFVGRIPAFFFVRNSGSHTSFCFPLTLLHAKAARTVVTTSLGVAGFWAIPPATFALVSHVQTAGCCWKPLLTGLP